MTEQTLDINLDWSDHEVEVEIEGGLGEINAAGGLQALVTQAPTRILEIEYEGPADVLLHQGSVLSVEVENWGDSTIEVASEGLQGPVGPAGPPGPTGGSAALVVTATAGETLSGHRVLVYRNGLVYYADPTDPDDIESPLYLSLGAALAGDPIQAIPLGELTESSWSWSPDDRIYLGANGLLTTTPSAPGAAWMAVVGYAISPTRIYFSPQQPIALSG